MRCTAYRSVRAGTDPGARASGACGRTSWRTSRRHRLREARHGDRRTRPGLHYPVFADSPPRMANFGQLEVAKYLILVRSIAPPQPGSAVVKTYPIPTVRFRSLDSPGHVSAEDPTEERWRRGLLWLAFGLVAWLLPLCSSPHFSPNRVHWGSDSERIVLQPRFFSDP
jgi:hypothetical protein